jgi:hypothetical protein
MRVTELSNELTSDLDITPPSSMMTLFQKTNTEIFHGWRNELCINDKHHLGKELNLRIPSHVSSDFFLYIILTL